MCNGAQQNSCFGHLLKIPGFHCQIQRGLREQNQVGLRSCLYALQKYKQCERLDEQSHCYVATYKTRSTKSWCCTLHINCYPQYPTVCHSSSLLQRGRTSSSLSTPFFAQINNKEMISVINKRKTWTWCFNCITTSKIAVTDIRCHTYHIKLRAEAWRVLQSMRSGAHHKRKYEDTIFFCWELPFRVNKDNSNAWIPAPYELFLALCYGCALLDSI